MLLKLNTYVAIYMHIYVEIEYRFINFMFYRCKFASTDLGWN